MLYFSSCITSHILINNFVFFVLKVVLHKHILNIVYDLFLGGGYDSLALYFIFIDPEDSLYFK